MSLFCFITIFVSFVINASLIQASGSTDQSQNTKQEFPSRSVEQKTKPEQLQPFSSQIGQYLSSNPDELSSHSDKDQVIDLRQIWAELDISSEIWPQIVEMKTKEICVARYIDLYRQNGIIIRKDALHYAQMMDGLIQQTPSLLSSPFKNALRLMAIMEYDFENGTDKDLLARQILADEQYRANRKRLGLE